MADLRRAAALLSVALLLTGAPSALAGDALNDVAPEVLDALKDKLKDTDTANALLQPLVQSAAEGPLGFLDDLGVELKWFDADNTNEDPGLGFAYHFGRQIENWTIAGEQCGELCNRVGADFSVRATGNVAFDHDTNPEDFLDSSADFSLFASHGGPRSQTTEWRQAYVALGQELAKASTQEEVDVIEKKIHQHVAGALADQYFVDVSGKLGYEANQDFSARQLVFGGRIGLDAKAWRDLFATSYGETHLLSRINLLDYPFATLRWVTASEDCEPGVSRCFVPRGTTLPTISLGVSLVDPAEDDERRAAGGNMDPFPRFDAEASFKTLAFRIKNTGILFTASYRFYQEIAADSGIRRAGLDQFDYLGLTLGPDTGPFVRYARGQLPFDQRDQDVFELGLKADFKAIKSFLFH